MPKKISFCNRSAFCGAMKSVDAESLKSSSCTHLRDFYVNITTAENEFRRIVLERRKSGQGDIFLQPHQLVICRQNGRVNSVTQIKKRKRSAHLEIMPSVTFNEIIAGVLINKERRSGTPSSTYRYKQINCRFFNSERKFVLRSSTRQKKVLINDRRLYYRQHSSGSRCAPKTNETLMDESLSDHFQFSGLLLSLKFLVLHAYIATGLLPFRDCFKRKSIISFVINFGLLSIPGGSLKSTSKRRRMPMGGKIFKLPRRERNRAQVAALIKIPENDRFR